MKKHVMLVFGTRPEAIKMAPILFELRKHSEIKTTFVATSQHREMLDQVLEVFDIHSDYDLQIMKENQTLEDITNNVLDKLGSILNEEKPDILLVHGDTTTTMAASLSAFYHKIPVGHVEAGLRTWDKYSPYPEEMNRQITDNISDVYFAPTEQSRINLLEERHGDQNIYVTGNTAIDALNLTVRSDFHSSLLEQIPATQRIILLTMHRRENQGIGMRNVFKAVKAIVEHYSNVSVIFPVHLSPAVQKEANEILGATPNIYLTEPLNVVEFHNFAAKSYLILTDSGGVQEEAPSLGKPVLVLRDTTERPEGVKAGTLKLVGTEYDNVYRNIALLLNDDKTYAQMAEANNPYGDGQAAQRIVAAVIERLERINR